MNIYKFVTNFFQTIFMIDWIVLETIVRWYFWRRWGEVWLVFNLDWIRIRGGGYLVKFNNCCTSALLPLSNLFNVFGPIWLIFSENIPLHPNLIAEKTFWILNFLDLASSFSRNPEKLVLTVYLHVLHHFLSFQDGEFIFWNRISNLVDLFLNL